VHATHDACLYRKFRVGTGKGVRASVWCMNVTHDQDGTTGGHGMRVGIDPTGGEDHTADSVVYGDYWSSYMDGWKEREWRQVDVETVSQGDEITVFLHARCDFPVDINASHWDDFSLEVGEASEVVVPPSAATTAQPGYPTLEQIEAVVRKVVREELERLQQ
jgi:hypothetical protein